MRYSILHISDLHRDLSNEMHNDVLLDSLSAEFEKWESETPRIQRPAIAVVTGDLVYGVQPGVDATTELERQYGQAIDFLTRLRDRFFDGDTSRVVLLPGNHDIDLATVRGCMEKVETPTADDARRKLVGEYFGGDKSLRWVWPELSFYRIVNDDAYRQRLAAFATAYGGFYPERPYSLDPESQYAVFDYPEFRLSVVALDSCYRNDPYHRSGGFNPVALSRVREELRRPERNGHLYVAAWHHSVAGVPEQDDYVDAEIIQNLVDAGVSLGLHGHQHRSAAIDERYRIAPSTRKMVIVSAGTLCGGPRALPPAVARSYNVIEVDTEPWSVRVHQRQMINSAFETPIWGKGRFAESGESSIQLELSPPLRAPVARIDTEKALERADALFAARQYDAAIGALTGHHDDERARRLLFAALRALPRTEILTSLWPPTTPEEIVTVGSAAIATQDRALVARLLALDIVQQEADASVLEIRRRLERLS